MNTLDEWETEAFGWDDRFAKQVVILIALLKKKDAALGFINARINFTEFPNLRGSSEECKALSDCAHISETAMLLTKELK